MIILIITIEISNERLKKIKNKSISLFDAFYEFEKQFYSIKLDFKNFTGYINKIFLKNEIEIFNLPSHDYFLQY